MKRFAKILALLGVMLALPYGIAKAADWTEIQTTFLERINGKLDGNLTGAYLHYIDGKAVGVNYSGKNDGGASTAWRVYERDWQSGWTLGFHVIASTNLLDGEGDNDLNAGLEARIGWPEFGVLKTVAGHGDGEIIVGVGQFQFTEGAPAEYAVRVGIAWWPGGRN